MTKLLGSHGDWYERPRSTTDHGDDLPGATSGLFRRDESARAGRVGGGLLLGSGVSEEQRRRARVPAGLGLLLPHGLRRARERARPLHARSQDDALRPPARSRARGLGRPARRFGRREVALLR